MRFKTVDHFENQYGSASTCPRQYWPLYLEEVSMLSQVALKLTESVDECVL